MVSRKDCKGLVATVLAGVLMVFFAGRSYAALADKIGYVDLQKAVQSTQAGRKAKDSLTREFEQRKKEIQTKQDELKKLSEDLEKKSMVMNPKARETQTADFQKKAMAFQEHVQKSQLEMQEKEKELTQPILDQMEELIAEIAKEKGLSMVLEKNKSAVLFAPKENDYTEMLISKYEEKQKKK